MADHSTVLINRDSTTGRYYWVHSSDVNFGSQRIFSSAETAVADAAFEHLFKHAEKKVIPRLIIEFTGE